MTNETEQYCAAIHPLLPAFSIGATDPDETALVQKHLAACPQADVRAGKLSDAG